jgi:hypothetical protein
LNRCQDVFAIFRSPQQRGELGLDVPDARRSVRQEIGSGISEGRSMTSFVALTAMPICSPSPAFSGTAAMTHLPGMAGIAGAFSAPFLFFCSHISISLFLVFPRTTRNITL